MVTNEKKYQTNLICNVKGLANTPLEAKPVSPRRCIADAEALNVLNANTLEGMHVACEDEQTENTSIQGIVPPEAEKQKALALLPAQALSGNDSGNDSNYYLPQVWAEFLDRFTWDWYTHKTFRDNPHPEMAIKTWDVFIHRLNREIYGCRYWKDKRKGVYWARATELQRRGIVHFHSLIGDIPGYVEMMKYFELWRLLGGFCRFYRYEKDRGAEFYMSKSTYAWKRGEIDVSETLKKEVNGLRISAKKLNDEFIGQFINRLRLPFSSFNW